MINPEINNRLSKVLVTMGYEYIGCEMINQGKHLGLRVYIDAAKGITIEDCAKVSRQLNMIFKVEEWFQTPFTLEVSSPGIDRPLFERVHFEKSIGQRIKVVLYLPKENRKKFKGLLLTVQENGINILDEETEQKVQMSFSEIKKANVMGEVHF